MCSSIMLQHSSLTFLSQYYKLREPVKDLNVIVLRGYYTGNYKILFVSHDAVTHHLLQEVDK